MSIYETSITNPKKQLEFYKDLSKELQKENKELKKQLEKKYEKLGTLTAEILYEENTRLVNEITVLKTENQKLKEMQCTFLGTGCQNKIKEYKEVIDKAILELTNIDGNLSNSQLSDRICNLVDILSEVK